MRHFGKADESFLFSLTASGVLCYHRTQSVRFCLLGAPNPLISWKTISIQKNPREKPFWATLGDYIFNTDTRNKKQNRTNFDWRNSSDLLRMVTRSRIELLLPPWKGGVLTAWPTGLVAEVGLEPTTYRVWTDCSSQLSYSAINFRLLEYYIT